jgi:hypothetical protein
MLHHDRVLAELLESLRDEFPLQQPWCWWDRIDDASAPTIDVEELKAGSDFAADLITMSHDLLRRCSTPALALGLDAELPTDLLEDITSTLPRALRARLLASHMSASELIEAGLTTALDELGAGSDLAPTGHLT